MLRMQVTRCREMIAGYQPKQMDDSGVRMHLILRDYTPVYQNPHGLSHTQAEGVVRPSVSDYVSGIDAEEKRRQPRLCADYRELNGR